MATILALALALSGNVCVGGAAPAVYNGRAHELRVHPARLDAAATVDGRLDEPAWREAALLTGFSQFTPRDGIAAEDSTEVLVWYSPSAIYFGVRAYEPHRAPHATLGQRDHVLDVDDNVQLFLDTFNDAHEAVVLAVNPLGVQVDGTLREAYQSQTGAWWERPAARQPPDLSQDFVFESRGRVTEWGYEVEVRVPFKSLTFQAQSAQRWGFNTVRRVQHSGLENSWAPARRGAVSFLAQSGTLDDLRDVHRGLVLDLNPAVTQRTIGAPPSADDGRAGWAYDAERPEVGATARWRVTNNATLNATLNPDFSQVESDAGQIPTDPRAALLPGEAPVLPRQPGCVRHAQQPGLHADDPGAGGRSEADGPAAAHGRGTPLGRRRPRPVQRIRTRPRRRAPRRQHPARPERRRCALARGAHLHRPCGRARLERRGERRRHAGARTSLRGAAAARREPLRRRHPGDDRAALGSGLRPERYAVWRSLRADRDGSRLPHRRRLRRAPRTRRRPVRPSRHLLRRARAPRRERVVRADCGGELEVRPPRARRRRAGQEAAPHLALPAPRRVDRGALGPRRDVRLRPGQLPRRVRRAGAGRARRHGAVHRDAAASNLDYVVAVNTPQWQWLGASALYLWGRDEDVDEWASANVRYSTVDVLVHPTERLRIASSFAYASIGRRATGEVVKLQRVLRLKTEYQLARPLFVRIVGEYDGLDKLALLDESRTNGALLFRNPDGTLTQRAGGGAELPRRLAARLAAQPGHRLLRRLRRHRRAPCDLVRRPVRPALPAVRRALLQSELPVATLAPRAPAVAPARGWSRLLAGAGLLALAAACRPTADHGIAASPPIRLPTGRLLDPTGRTIDVGNMPLAVAVSPDRRYALVLLSGWRQQGLQVVDLAADSVVQTLPQAGAFLGLAFSPDGRSVYASGAARNVVYRYAWALGRVTLRDSLVLASDTALARTRFVAGLAVSTDGGALYVAENMTDSLAVVDVGSGRVIQRLPTGHYPYAVAIGPAGDVYVSAWGGTTVAVFHRTADGRLTAAGRIEVGRHPSALALSPTGDRLFVACSGTDRIAVVDTRTGRVITELADPAPGGPREGSTPNALALSADGARLYVAEADNNAVAVFDLSTREAGARTAAPTAALVGRIPVLWYPTALAVTGDSLLVVSGKGRGSGPNARGPRNALAGADPRTYTLGQLNGTVSVVSTALPARELAVLSGRVARANGWDSPRGRASYPPFQHVVLVIKENRTYDQVLGDMPEGDGDTALVFFPRAVSPNHHALAERFGLYDRFFVNAEVSAQGHPWSTSAYVTEYTEKLTPTWYSDRRPEANEGDADEPATGYLWSAAAKKGLSVRNYGEYAEPDTTRAGGGPTGVREREGSVHYRAARPSLAPYTSPDYPPFDMTVPDQRRADVWLAELAQHARDGRMPALEILHLPGDHTAGARPGLCTPRACMADNDLALGRIIAGLTRSPFWTNTAVFVLEDDAQAGPDHVDSHRSVLLVISAYGRPGVVHRFVNTTDVLATIEEILSLEPLSQFDHYGRPLRDVWSATPDLRPYEAVTPAQSLAERNAPKGVGARESRRLDLAAADRIDDAAFNHLLWRVIKGDTLPYPRPRRGSVLDVVRQR